MKKEVVMFHQDGKAHILIGSERLPPVPCDPLMARVLKELVTLGYSTGLEDGLSFSYNKLVEINESVGQVTDTLKEKGLLCSG